MSNDWKLSIETEKAAEISCMETTVLNLSKIEQ